MATLSSTSARRHSRSHRAQRGVVMIITLVALTILMAGSVALMRSSSTSSSLAGQLSFRRDLKNQGERGIAQALAALRTGTLSSSTTRQTSLGAANYSATKLSANAQGVPTLLTQGADAFVAAGMTGADLGATGENNGVTVRTVIDRLCKDPGAASDSGCVRVPQVCTSPGVQSGSSVNATQIQCMGTAYRISVRVDGPRQTQAFFQSVVAL